MNLRESKLLEPKWLLLPLLQMGWSHFVFHSLLFLWMRAGTQICCTDVFVYVHHGFSWTLVKRHAFPFKELFWPKLWLLHGLIVGHICCALLRLYMCHCICHWDEWEYTLCPVICELVLAFLFILYAVDLNVDLAQQFCWSGLFCLSSLQLHQQIHHIVFSTTHPTQTFFIWSREAKKTHYS